MVKISISQAGQWTLSCFVSCFYMSVYQQSHAGWYHVLSLYLHLVCSTLRHTSERWWKETEMTDDDVKDQRSRAKFSALVINTVVFTPTESTCVLHLNCIFFLKILLRDCLSSCVNTVCSTRISQTNTQLRLWPLSFQPHPAHSV